MASQRDANELTPGVAERALAVESAAVEYRRALAEWELANAARADAKRALLTAQAELRAALHAAEVGHG